MCGCLAGTLPQVPQQNVFLGLPLQLMTEEAALLVEKGAAYIVDDKEAHKDGLKSMMERDKEMYLERRRLECEKETLKHVAEAEERTKKFAHAPGYKKVKHGKGKQQPKAENMEETKPEESKLEPNDLFDFGDADTKEVEPPLEPELELQLPTKETPAVEEPEQAQDAPELDSTPEVDDEDIPEAWNASRLPQMGRVMVIAPPLSAESVETTSVFSAASLPLFGTPTLLPTTIEVPTTTNPEAIALTTIPTAAAPTEPAPTPTVPQSIDSVSAPSPPTPAPTKVTSVSHPEALRFYPIEAVTPSIFHAPQPTTALLPTPDPASYPVYRHLQSRGYYLSPGLRFGSQFMAYPGDPLRFHSHFVVRGLDWDEEIDVLDVIAGGRLGTGVKKAWMMGGVERENGEKVVVDGEDKMRTYCVEWGGF